MSDEDTVVVEYDKAKRLGVIIGTLAFAGVCAWGAARPSTSIFVRVLLTGFALVLGAVVVRSSLRLVRNTPALTVDREGFVDATDATCFGRVRWDEVCDVQVKDRPVRLGGVVPATRKDVAVRLRDPAAFFSRWPDRTLPVDNGWIVLEVGGLKIDADDIAEIFNRYIPAANRPPLSPKALGV